MTMGEMYSAVDAINAIKVAEDGAKSEDERNAYHKSADIILDCFDGIEKYYYWDPLTNMMEPKKVVR